MNVYSIFDMNILAIVSLYILAAVQFIEAANSGCVFINQIHDHPALAKLNKLAGKRYSTTDNLNTYTYTVGICTDAESSSLPNPNAGIVQRKADSPQSSALVIGKYTQSVFMAGNNWMLLEYRGGDKYSGKCGNEARKGAIMIQCDPDESEGSLILVEENTGKNAECYFLFELSHSAICSAEKMNPGLSAGSIIVIILGVLVGMYLLGGFLYQRFVAGAKGWEQIPNNAFWQDFGNLLADGCDLVCRSGSRRHQMAAPHGSREYKGIGDDQLDDDDFDRDEHLLPM